MAAWSPTRGWHVFAHKASEGAGEALWAPIPAAAGRALADDAAAAAVKLGAAAPTAAEWPDYRGRGPLSCAAGIAAAETRWWGRRADAGAATADIVGRADQLITHLRVHRADAADAGASAAAAACDAAIAAIAEATAVTAGEPRPQRWVAAAAAAVEQSVAAVAAEFAAAVAARSAACALDWFAHWHVTDCEARSQVAAECRDDLAGVAAAPRPIAEAAAALGGELARWDADGGAPNPRTERAAQARIAKAAAHLLAESLPAIIPDTPDDPAVPDFALAGCAFGAEWDGDWNADGGPAPPARLTGPGPGPGPALVADGRAVKVDLPAEWDDARAARATAMWADVMGRLGYDCAPGAAEARFSEPFLAWVWATDVASGRVRTQIPV